MLPHYLAKFRSSNIGISGRKWKWKCTMPWILNTRPILMHLAYLLTYLFQFPVPVKYFLNSRRCYLKKCCELKQRFLHVWHGIDQTIIDNAIDEWRGRIRACMRAKGGHFEQLFWQYSATWQETFQFLSNVTRFLNCFFLKLPQIQTSIFRKVLRQHTEGMMGSIICTLLEIYFSFSSEEILKIR